MFDSEYPYQFVQRDSNKSLTERYIFKHVYKFFIHKGSSLRKYIVVAREYNNHLFIIDFYAKLGKNDINNNKYRYTTNQYAFGRIGSIVLRIMRELETKYENISFCIVAARLINEESDKETKRFKSYSEILRRQYVNFTPFVYEDNSIIFVIKNENIEHKQQILEQYAQILDEIL